MRGLAMAGEVAGVDAAQQGLITAMWTFAGVVVGACGLWLANRLLGKAAFQTAINDGFSRLVNELQEERERERVAWAAERAQLRGEIINLTQAVESLKSHLRRSGLAIPEGPPHPAPDFMILKGDNP